MLRNKLYDLLSAVRTRESGARSVLRLVQTERFQSVALQVTDEEEKELLRAIEDLDILALRRITNGVPVRLMREAARHYGVAKYSRLTKTELSEALGDNYEEVRRNGIAPRDATIPQGDQAVQEREGVAEMGEPDLQDGVCERPAILPGEGHAVRMEVRDADQAAGSQEAPEAGCSLAEGSDPASPQG